MDRPAVFDRIPPQSLEAEQSVLASMILDKSALERVTEILKAEDFYREAHQKLFTAVSELSERGEPVDLVTLGDELRVRGILDAVGGLSYITLLLDTVPTARNAEYYARIVEEKAILRRLIEASSEISAMAYTQSDEVMHIVDRAENLIFKVAQRRVGKYFYHLKDLVVSSWEQISAQAEEEGVTTGVPTGFIDLNYQTSGFQPSDFIIIAARPSVGKTAFCLNLAVNAALQKGITVAVFSLEMSKEQLALRMLCSEARVSSHRLRAGYPREGDWERISDAMGRLSELPIYIDDSSEITTMEMRSKLRRLAAEHGLGLVIVDYIQLIYGSGSGRGTENRNQELSSISRALKGIAKEFGVPVIALSQLSRAVEQRQEKIPMLSDLRDCLPGDSLVLNADTGEQVPVSEVVGKGLRFNVWSLGPDWRLAKRPITDAWEVGPREMLRITTRTGRVLRCSPGHRLLTDDGWREARQVAVGDFLGTPRCYPEPSSEGDITVEAATLLGWLMGDGYLGGSPAVTAASSEEADQVERLCREAFDLAPTRRLERAGAKAVRVVCTTGRLCGVGGNPLTKWLRELGVWGQRGNTKRVPSAMFRQPTPVIAAFLRGLFHADGTLARRRGQTRVTVKLVTVSRGLARDVQHLLLRLGIVSSLRCDPNDAAGFRSRNARIYSVRIGNRDMARRFVETVGFLGAKGERARASLLDKQNDAGSLDRLPPSARHYLHELRARRGLSHVGLGWRDQGKSPSRGTALALADRHADPVLARGGGSDLVWDPIVSIEPQEPEEAYDITVGELHNFCADDFVVHNSGAIEQDADLVIFLHREKYYEREDGDDADMVEEMRERRPGQEEVEDVDVIIAKHRNGPTGKVTLAFLKEYARFENRMSNDYLGVP